MKSINSLIITHLIVILIERIQRVSNLRAIHFIQFLVWPSMTSYLVELLEAHAKQQGTNRPIVVIDCNNLDCIFSQSKKGQAICSQNGNVDYTCWPCISCRHECLILDHVVIKESFLKWFLSHFCPCKIFLTHSCHFRHVLIWLKCGVALSFWQFWLLAP